MAFKTLTVDDFRRMLDGLPGGQKVLLIDPRDGFAQEITGFAPETVTDVATGEKVLTLEIEVNADSMIGFDPNDGTKIDSSEDQD
jgi:hypothetical protein